MYRFPPTGADPCVCVSAWLRHTRLFCWFGCKSQVRSTCSCPIRRVLQTPERITEVVITSSVYSSVAFPGEPLRWQVCGWVWVGSHHLQTSTTSANDNGNSPRQHHSLCLHSKLLNRCSFIHFNKCASWADVECFQCFLFLIKSDF